MYDFIIPKWVRWGRGFIVAGESEDQRQSLKERASACCGDVGRLFSSGLKPDVGKPSRTEPSRAAGPSLDNRGRVGKTYLEPV
jgi:hypothetical protein